MNLSKNFTLTEFTKSQTAIRLGIDNTPNAEHIKAAMSLFKNVVQPIRDAFDAPVIISSGYRGPKLNTAVGGSSNSQHCNGEAVDIEIPGYSNYNVAEWIEDNIEYDQLILEFYTPGIPDSGWVHVSYKANGKNRKQSLTTIKENGKTVYKQGLIE